MRKKLLVIAVVGVALLTAPIVLAASAGPLVQVSSTTPFNATCGDFPGTIPGPGTLYVDSEVEPWVAVNPVHPNNIVGFYQQDRWSNGGSRGLVASVSTDSGANWIIVPVPGITDCTGGPWERASDPWVSFSPDGRLHQMSLVFNIDPPADRPGGFGPGAMLHSYSDDGGLTWSDPTTLVYQDNARVLEDKNSMTADPTDANYVYAVWDSLTITAADAIDPQNFGPVLHPAYGVRFGYAFRGPITFTRSTDGGETWEPARKIYEPGGNDQTIANQIVVQPDGTVIDFFSELLNLENSDHQGQGYNFDISLLRSTDKGETWLPHGRPIRAVRMFVNNTDVVTPDATEDVRAASVLFDVAVDPDNGNLYLVWQDVRFSGVYEVAFSMSTDGGFTWSTPIKVNQTPDNATNPLRQQAFLPSVEVVGGVVGITYYDFRNDDATGELADYWFASCATNCSDASNWGNELRLTPSSFDYADAPNAGGYFLGDYQGLASDGADFLAFFQQVVSGGQADGFFSRIHP
jgi:hypothetical protein